MSKEQIVAGLKRLARAFVAGGVGQVAILLSSGVQIKDLADLQNLLVILASGFVVGGLMGLEKVLRWQN